MFSVLFAELAVQMGISSCMSYAGVLKCLCWCWECCFGPLGIFCGAAGECAVGLYEIDHCAAFRPCSTRHMTPTRLLSYVLVEVGWVDITDRRIVGSYGISVCASLQ